MHFVTAALGLLASASFVSAADFKVLVGDSGLDFSPSSVNLQSGDTVNFEFRSKNHSVTQSSFAQPCARLTTAAGPGVDSGFQSVAPGSTAFPQWNITIDNATAPLWFYCAQTNPANHCQAGMVFAINPTADKSFNAFQAAAKASTPGAPPAGSASASASGAPSASTGGYSIGLPTNSGFQTSVSPTATGAANPATSSAGGNSTSGSDSGNGALSVRMNSGVLLAVIGLAAGLVL